jgi:hypothetical protein
MSVGRARGLPWLLAAVWGAAVVLLGPAGAPAQQYSLSFSKSSSRMNWSHRLPSWAWVAPVHFAAAGDSSSMLRMTASASINSVLDERANSRNWQDDASVNSSVNYPILGPRASVRIGANMSVRRATLTKQRQRNQTFDCGFQFSPVQAGRFRSLRVNVTPGLITASRANRANLDSVFEERGVQYNANLRVAPDFELGGSKLTNSVSVAKTDNTLKTNKSRSETYNGSLGYTLPGDLRTSLNLSESRSQVGIPRSVVAERTEGDTVWRDTTVAVEEQATRSTSVTSSVSFKLKGADLRTNGTYRGNLRTNTASADDAPNNTYFGKDREHTSWGFDSSVSGKPLPSLVAKSSLRYDASDEGYLSVRLPGGTVYRDLGADLTAEDLFLNGSLDWQAAPGHSVKVQVYAEVKTETNPGAPEQDQNAVSNSVSLGWDGTTKGETGISASLERKYYHRVNLAASLSADNLRNNDLILRFTTRYRRLGVSASHAFSISAKRTIFDFDREVNANADDRRSNIRRGWSMVHTARRQLVRSLEVNGRYSYSADDYGSLLLENGAQVVTQDNADHSVSIGLGYNPTSSLSLTSSYGYGLDRQWQYDYRYQQENRYLNRRSQNESLSLSTSYKSAKGTSLSMRGSRSRQLSGTYDSFTVTYSRPL